MQSRLHLSCNVRAIVSPDISMKRKIIPVKVQYFNLKMRACRSKSDGSITLSSLGTFDRNLFLPFLLETRYVGNYFVLWVYSSIVS